MLVIMKHDCYELGYKHNRKERNNQMKNRRENIMASLGTEERKGNPCRSLTYAKPYALLE